MGLGHLDFPALDQAMDLLLPSFSALALLSVLMVVIQLLLPQLLLLLPLKILLGITVLWVFFPFLGLLIDGAPASAYSALLYGPFYLLWRTWIGVKVKLKRGRIEWVRTKRREEIER